MHLTNFQWGTTSSHSSLSFSSSNSNSFTSTATSSLLLNILLLSTTTLFTQPAWAKSTGKSSDAGRSRPYKVGEKIMVECLNRTVDTGEHITDAKGELQYIPFPTCNETGRPLELVFGSEQDINCTIQTLSDPLFHLLEFYIHNDAPLSCRLPSLPSPSTLSKSSIKAEQHPDYTHLQFALTGTLQLSHLHINPYLNVIVHTTTMSSSSGRMNLNDLDSDGINDPSTEDQKIIEGSASTSAQQQEEEKKKKKKKSGKKATSEGAILAATAYSLPPTLASPKLVIGDPLPLRLSVRWYSARTLPASTSRIASSGLGGHVHLSTVMYCLLSFGGGIAVSLAYWRGWELPRRMRRFAEVRVGGGFGGGMEGGRGGGYAWPGSVSGKLD